MKQILFLMTMLLWPSIASAGGEAGGGLADNLSPLWVLPFAGMLLSIAIIPMVAHDWWERHRNQLLVSFGWSSLVLGYFGYLYINGQYVDDVTHGLGHGIEEYISFNALLGSLFVISGAIVLRGDLEGRPGINTMFLLVGSILANFIGTTGASMLLIRPMLRTNSQRDNVRHIPVFFIFLVSNIGGALTPIGDPPLFLGYLRGVPFFWTLEHLWQIWCMPMAMLLVLFFMVDSYFYGKESKKTRHIDLEEKVNLSIAGAWNFLLLGGVIASILLLSPNPDVVDFRHYYAREIAMTLLAGVSWVAGKQLRDENEFSSDPMKEVASLFIGIFITMIPATMLLKAHGSALGVDTPMKYFWATGLLSGFLDNAPTYVTFATMACGQVAECASPEQLGTLALSQEGTQLLVAISAGAVFMGPLSYIGNGPNLMVRGIAKDMGYQMPSFFGYFGVAMIILTPIFIVVSMTYFA